MGLLSEINEIVGQQNTLSGLQQWAASGGASADPDLSNLAQVAPRAYEQLAPTVIQRQLQMGLLGLAGQGGASSQPQSALQQYGSTGDSNPSGAVPQSLPSPQLPASGGTATGQFQQPVSGLAQLRQAFALGNGNMEAGFKALQAQKALAIPPGVGAAPSGQQYAVGPDGQVTATTIPGAMTEGQKDRDKDFADVYTPFKNTGGMQTQQSQIQAIQGVIQKLSRGPNGEEPQIKTGEGSLAPFAFNDEGEPSIVARVADNPLLQANNQVMKAVLPSAKALFGPRVTQKEVAMNLMANGLNPYAKNEENVTNLTTLKNNLMNANQQTAAAGSYFDQHGTLAGYQGSLPSAISGTSQGTSVASPSNNQPNPALLQALQKRGLIKQ